eukprot:7379093-Prymnesium_polylepis.1
MSSGRNVSGHSSSIQAARGMQMMVSPRQDFIASHLWSTQEPSVRTVDDDGIIGGTETCQPSSYGGPDANGTDG